MGLDCTAISKVTYVGVGNHGDPNDKYYEGADAGYCQDDDHVQVFSYDGFAEHALKGMTIKAPKGYCNDGFTGGDCYATTAASQSFGWRAGSYGGYNAFRNSLAALSGHSDSDFWGGEADENWPFYELVNFADNEGVLGTDACRNLLEDFRTFRDDYLRANSDDWDRERYDDWITALELAADDGLVVFH